MLNKKEIYIKFPTNDNYSLMPRIVNKEEYDNFWNQDDDDIKEIVHLRELLRTNEITQKEYNKEMYRPYDNINKKFKTIYFKIFEDEMEDLMDYYNALKDDKLIEYYNKKYDIPLKINFKCNKEIENLIIKNNIVSPVEQKLIIELYQNDIKFNVQQLLLNKYKVDFLLESNIVIEIDGYNYHSSKEQMIKDHKRDRELNLNGYHVYRFMGTEIYNNTDNVLEELKTIINYYK